MDVDWTALRAAATGVMRRAYAPYSTFPVGAAGLVDDGRVVLGCNVENAAYGVALCAECGLVSQLHATGGGRLVAVSCVDASGAALMPCGRCRQLLWEHGGPRCRVDAEPVPRTLAELLPDAFDVSDLDAVVPATSHAPVVPAGLVRWRGQGTVFVHQDMAGGERVWTGYWERSSGPVATPPGPDRGPAGGGPAGILEEAPTWPVAADAVAWGRARTPRVVVIDTDGEAYWAGDGEPLPGLRGGWPA